MRRSYPGPAADMQRDNGAWLQQFEKRTTRLGRIWAEINRRCKPQGEFQKKRPTYTGCRNAFADFQAFSRWAVACPGYGEVDEDGHVYQIDKDLLLPGNKVYSEETCCFVPRRLNSLLLACDSKRGNLPLGVCRETDTGKFLASIAKRNLGRFSTPESAHKAWQREKVLAILSAANNLPEHLDHVSRAITRHAQLILDDLANGRETVRGPGYGDV